MSRKMPLVYNDPEHWQLRALEARSVADRIDDPDVQARMLNIALQYDKIVDRAVQRLKARAIGRPPFVYSEANHEPHG